MKSTGWSSSNWLRARNKNKIKKKERRRKGGRERGEEKGRKRKGNEEGVKTDKKRLWYMAWRYGVELEAEKRKLTWLSLVSGAYKMELTDLTLIELEAARVNFSSIRGGGGYDTLFG